MASISRTTKAEHHVNCRLILYVIVCQGTVVLHLLAGIDEALVDGKFTFLLIDLHLDIVDSIRAVNLKNDFDFV